MKPLLLSAYTATTCLGVGLEAHRVALREDRSGLQPCAFETVDLPTWIGEVAGVDDHPLPDALSAFECRNHRLALLALRADGFEARVRAAVARYGADRVGVFMGTSTSGILETELAYRQRDPASGALPPSFHYATSHNPYALAELLREHLGIGGMATTISTACSSSAKVFAAAARQIELGTLDAALVGGVDSLCLTTLYGFASLELTSTDPCRPCDVNRNGISIGEGAAYALLERTCDTPEPHAVWLLGAGESSDAYHMSAPHPDGLGAQMAMQAALRSASLPADAVDYINLHGTATPANDSAEGKAVAAVFGASVPCSSTKGATGHTLGAAGALEAVVCALALVDGFVPGSAGTRELDPAIALRVQRHSASADLRHALTNSFGFGGSNCSLVFGKAAP
ncbi:MAG: beta-ketoacyl-[acyl-carrier-protein] synthase family protein [Hydrogenophaga sp.]|uniref:beta-ketoacyl-[acyl-carrier-protein] synthase family protein n=1 Tax=Hydrogenophaga sp. TaxID=1904254 RepID=UPI001D8A1BC9|nr:beta-ketoacyl-[acyl-carrier-protein] synthase family protein [Hydrogenophaga sp.]MBW0169185.1 beta-ketoacyl-[acyl-carrier-protein] synthase family protein [Hydrogenophaga sp.]MBW0183241.1 beta-ketoacyl-[acyl-carrier-protein] synthase family protein [Hydrogenophaga sp.]